MDSFGIRKPKILPQPAYYSLALISEVWKVPEEYVNYLVHHELLETSLVLKAGAVKEYVESGFLLSSRFFRQCSDSNLSADIGMLDRWITNQLVSFRDSRPPIKGVRDREHVEHDGHGGLIVSEPTFGVLHQCIRQVSEASSFFGMNLVRNSEGDDYFYEVLVDSYESSFFLVDANYMHNWTGEKDERAIRLKKVALIPSSAFHRVVMPWQLEKFLAECSSTTEFGRITEIPEKLDGRYEPVSDRANEKTKAIARLATVYLKEIGAEPNAEDLMRYLEDKGEPFETAHGSLEFSPRGYLYEGEFYKSRTLKESLRDSIEFHPVDE